MANSFRNQTTVGIGTTETAVYQVPAGSKAIVIGLAMSNTTAQELPIRITLRKADSSNVQLVDRLRIGGGMTDDFIRGKKLVMLEGEQLRVSSAADQSVDCVVSVLEGVD